MTLELTFHTALIMKDLLINNFSNLENSLKLVAFFESFIIFVGYINWMYPSVDFETCCVEVFLEEMDIHRSWRD